MKLCSVIPMKIAKYGYIAISVILCIAGIAILLFPSPPLASIGIFFGITMLIFGIIKLIGYFSKDLFRLAFQYDLQFGILLTVLGAVTLLKRENAVEFICTAYGISLIADSLFKIKTAYDAKNFGIRRWRLTLILAVICGFAGLLVMIWPSVAIKIVKALFGISLITEGTLSLSVAINMVKIIDHQQPEIIDVDFYEVGEEK